jgi:hypothetical protein
VLTPAPVKATARRLPPTSRRAESRASGFLVETTSRLLKKA